VAETWDATDKVFRALAGFTTGWPRTDEWVYPRLKTPLRLLGWPRRQSLLVDRIATRPILEICREEERLSGSSRRLYWWERVESSVDEHGGVPPLPRIPILMASGASTDAGYNNMSPFRTRGLSHHIRLPGFVFVVVVPRACLQTLITFRLVLELVLPRLQSESVLLPFVHGACVGIGLLYEAPVRALICAKMTGRGRHRHTALVLELVMLELVLSG
jgi:hypothetical protein